MQVQKEQQVWCCFPRDAANPEAGGHAVREWVKSVTPWTVETVRHPFYLARAHDWSGEFTRRFDAETMRASWMRGVFLSAELPAAYREAGNMAQVAA